MAPPERTEESGQSVADALSSIRQVLNSGEQEKKSGGQAEEGEPSAHADGAPGDEDDEVFVLSPAMMEEDPSLAPHDQTSSGQLADSGSINLLHDSHADAPGALVPAEQNGNRSPVPFTSAADDSEVLSVTDLRQIELIEKAENMSGSLPIPLNDETMSDTGNSFAVLQKTLQEKYLREHEERKVAITHEGSLTVEDIVRQEVRVFLKKWLDAHLAGIVQAAVRKEVERLTQRGL
ncbi:DUF2497 domain-containing protein [Acetobacter farinalis]|uniref:DUF2497 domain-containing protein n=1 Tax=Acetobacter farinalis TaxID=1260984 RepID=A0ABT3Q566_9PROT|nr:DUF2497 domain-containing protein [Acetobacter farinalis]MCX2560433.1 DUF2497 domain-containing protein [Acetobacter farinalis]NHO29088.1 DUF2497 domain-containing protein [Acetobacter farinalis]